LTGTFFVGTLTGMGANEQRRGRPKKDPARAKGEYLDIRLEAAEKQAFRDAAELAGLDLSAWVRERLRLSARRELEAVGRTVAFLQKRPATSGSGSSGET
jgi:hypothetical protein